MFKIWGERSFLSVQKVMWLVGELELAYDDTPLDGKLEGLDCSNFVTMSLHEREPVLADNGVVAWESHTILRYLATLYRRSLLYPEDDRDCPEVWMNWVKTAFQPDFQMGYFWEGRGNKFCENKYPLVQEGISRCTRHAQVLNRALSGRKFLGGEKLALADIAAGTVIYRYLELDIEHPSVPNVEAWYKRLQERPAYRESVMISFKNLGGQPGS
ncbi:TPA: glutathione S-transferase family protein [Pseudomonas aeruginosa]|nr:glutathione S-transferase family protein [Pseudomonas aeruginosa]